MSTQPEMQVLRASREDSWGDGKGADSWYGISVAVGNYGIAPANTVDRPRKSEGTWEQSRAKRTEMAVAGPWIPQVYPELAEWLMDTFYYRDANGNMYSYVTEWKTPSVETRRHIGIMVNRARIESRSGGEFMLTLDCLAKNELGSEDSVTDFTTPSFPSMQPYYFLDLGGTGFIKYGAQGAEADIDTVRGFIIEVNNNLEPGPYKGEPPILDSLKPGAQQVTVEIADELHSNDYRRDVRDWRPRGFSAKWVHRSGSTIQIDIPQIEADTSEETAENIVMTNPRYTARKKDASTAAITITVSYASA
jgi:hypothetical protein